MVLEFRVYLNFFLKDKTMCTYKRISNTGVMYVIKSPSPVLQLLGMVLHINRQRHVNVCVIKSLGINCFY